MAPSKTSYRNDDKPRYESDQQTVDDKGTPYFYEEIEVPEGKFEQTGNGLLANGAKIVLIKTGRVVNLYVSGINSPAYPDGGSVVFTAPEAQGGFFIPERMRPCIKEGSNQTGFTCPLVQFGGNPILGRMTVEKDTGKMIFDVASKNNVANQNVVFTTAEAGESIGWNSLHFSWIADGVTNVATAYE